MLNNEEGLVDESMVDDIEPNIYYGKRYRMKGVGGRDQYIIVDEGGIMITFPDNKIKDWNYQATATALTRIISVAIQAGVDMSGIIRQLKESSMQKYDTPSILLEAINNYQKQCGANEE